MNILQKNWSSELKSTELTDECQMFKVKICRFSHGGYSGGGVSKNGAIQKVTDSDTENRNQLTTKSGAPMLKKADLELCWRNFVLLSIF